jgi:hypothetical protein
LDFNSNRCKGNLKEINRDPADEEEKGETGQRADAITGLLRITPRNDVDAERLFVDKVLPLETIQQLAIGSEFKMYDAAMLECIGMRRAAAVR